MGGMGTAWRESTQVPALRVPVLLMGLGEAARALGQPSEASTPSESIALDLSAARRPPHKNSAAESTEAGKRGRSHGETPRAHGRTCSRCRDLVAGDRAGRPIPDWRLNSRLNSPAQLATHRDSRAALESS